MNNEEIESLIKQLKATGLGDEEIMDIFYEAFKKGEMDRKDLETLSEALGYELTDDFKNDPTPDPISGETDGGDLSKEQLEDAKAIEPGESVEEFKEDIDDIKEDNADLGNEDNESEENGDEGEETEEDDSEDSEGGDMEAEDPEGLEEEDSDENSDDEDWEKAQKMFKI